MKFCKLCRNMMLLTSDEETRYKCPCCSNTEEIDKGASHVILTRRLRGDNTHHTKYMTKDLVHDKTLPVAVDVQCPLCEKGSEVIFVKYSKELKYLYMCKSCERFWKAGEAPMEGDSQSTTA